jgi:hypothetical protein
MNKDLKRKEHSNTQPDIQKNKHYREFLAQLGIDPEDFEDDFEIEIDDYAK